MEIESGYNGWTNYETWCLHLWLTNEEGSYRYWREEARRHRAESHECEQVKEEIWTKEQAAKFNLAEQLKDEIEDASPFTEATLFSDLLNAALSEGEDDESEEASDWEKPPVSDELKFSLGQVVGTPGAVAAVTDEERLAALKRHHRGDWGDVGRDDWQANDEALTEGSRLFSVYHAKDGTEFWIITEADRSSTCVLLPSEY